MNGISISICCYSRINLLWNIGDINIKIMNKSLKRIFHIVKEKEFHTNKLSECEYKTAETGIFLSLPSVIDPIIFIFS